MTALVCFEHLITFNHEIDFLWRHKWSAATWLFVFNRYSLLTTVMFVILPFGAQVSTSNQYKVLLLIHADVSINPRLRHICPYAQAHLVVTIHVLWTLCCFSLLGNLPIFLFMVRLRCKLMVCGLSHALAQHFPFYAPSRYYRISRGDVQQYRF